MSFAGFATLSSGRLIQVTINWTHRRLMLVPGLLVQLLQLLWPGVLGEELRLQLVVSLEVSLHLAEGFQVSGR